MSEQKTMFGVPAEHPQPERKGHPLGYSWARAYPSCPGTGPKNETCKTCKHYVVVMGHSKPYRKCGIMRNAWTKGAASDIKASSPACKNWWIKL